MRVIGLDLGTKLGYAYTNDDRVRSRDSGVADFSPRRQEGGGMRFLRFRKFLGQLITDPDDTVIFYEEVAPQAHRGGAAAHVFGGFLGVLSEFCEGSDPPIPYRGIPIATIKRAATGKGNAGKAHVLAAAFSKFGPVESEDAADALWTLSCGLKELGDG